MTQEEFDEVGKRISKLQKKYGASSTELEKVKQAYLIFLESREEYDFGILKGRVDEVERLAS